MTTAAEVSIDTGIGANVATYTVTESTKTRHLQRIVLNDSSGNEVNSSPIGQTTSAASVSIVGALDWTASVGGDTAAGSSDSGNPVKIGGIVRVGLSGVTLRTTSDRADVALARDGAVFTHPHCGLEDIVSGTASATTTTTTICIAAQAAGIKTYLTSICVTNASTFPTKVTIFDGTTAKYVVPAPNNNGFPINFTVPLPGTAATAWLFASSDSTTSITCSMIGFKSKV